MLALLAALALAAEASSAAARPSALTADFDGSGRTLTAKASARGKSALLEIDDASGKRLATENVPAPAGASSVRVAGGSLGSPGTVIEVVAARPDQECRSFWRFREGKLARLPARRGDKELPDCEQPEGWTAAWEKKASDAPAVWVRARARETARGTHREREVYAFSGFSLDFDLARSSGEIGGVTIPAWNENILYTPTALDNLSNRFDLTRFRAAPRLKILADRAQGLFALEFTDHAGRWTAPVIASAQGLGPNEIDLTLRADTGTGSARVTVRDAIVTEAVVSGVPSRWSGGYNPSSRFNGGALVIYARAEDEVASNDLVGLWASERGEQLALNLAEGKLGVLDMRNSQFDVLLDPVPAGTDVLLVPKDGTAPTWALVLKGANGIDRAPVKCEASKGAPWSCQKAGPAEPFHRVGGRMNAR